MTEIWKNIVCTNGRYAVSSAGKVRNNKTGKILKQALNHKGYSIVALGKGKTKTVHRLVAETFIPNPDGKPCVDHINTVRYDNRVENLRWVTYSENNNNPITFLRMVRAQGKPVVQLTVGGTAIGYYEYIQSAENKTGAIRQNIRDCCNGKGRRKTTGGYRWMYYEDYLRFY